MSEHRDLTGSDLHEMKGIETASAGQVYIADGEGSGTWETLPGLLKSSAFPIGTTLSWPGIDPPTGWAFCFGQELDRSVYSGLFFIIGTNFGVGNGVNTFNLPDCRGRIIAGSDQGSGRLTAGNFIQGSIGSKGGVERASLTSATIPAMSATSGTSGSHTHSLNNATSLFRSTSATQWATRGSGSMGTATISLASAGSHNHTITFNASSPNTPHNNVQPTIILNTIIFHGVSG